MGITVGVIAESFPGERRIAVVPLSLAALAKAGAKLIFERGAGEAAGFPDAEYEQKGARAASRDEVLAGADVLLQVRTAGANPH
ncbi:MAG TPA: hypothetical protein VHA11_14990, partial [Bryobacteraceae bacterium]|nr:hypothetical protein [Bryobacteraceae bacterium]